VIIEKTPPPRPVVFTPELNVDGNLMIWAIDHFDPSTKSIDRPFHYSLDLVDHRIFLSRNDPQPSTSSSSKMWIRSRSKRP